MAKDGNDKSSIRSINSTTGKSINHFHYHIIPDFEIKAVSIHKNGNPRDRKILKEEEITEMRDNWKKWAIKRNSLFSTLPLLQTPTQP